jgi:hypothetical protein
MTFKLNSWPSVSTFAPCESLAKSWCVNVLETHGESATPECRVRLTHMIAYYATPPCDPSRSHRMPGNYDALVAPRTE